MWLSLPEKETDRRVFDRFPARFPAKLKDSREQFGEVINVKDASAMGAQVNTTNRLFVNDKISIEVNLPEENMDPMVLRGEVVWVKPNDMDNWDAGVRLHQVSLMSMSRLYRYVVGPA